MERGNIHTILEDGLILQFCADIHAMWGALKKGSMNK